VRRGPGQRTRADADLIATRHPRGASRSETRTSAILPQIGHSPGQRALMNPLAINIDGDRVVYRMPARGRCSCCSSTAWPVAQ
jgi:hypothetical protein